MTKSKNVNCERIDIYACMYALTSTCSWNKMSSVSNDLTCTTPTFKKHVHLPLSLQSCRITGFFSTAARRNTSSTCLRRQKILFVNPTLQSVNAPFPWRIWRVPSQCTPEFPRIEGLIRFNLNTRPYGFISGGGEGVVPLEVYPFEIPMTFPNRKHINFDPGIFQPSMLLPVKKAQFHTIPRHHFPPLQIPGKL